MPSSADTERAAAVPRSPALSEAAAGKYLIIGLHGYGGQGSDIRTWLRMIRGEQTHFYTPCGPHESTLARKGFEWFPITSDVGRMRDRGSAVAHGIAKDIKALQARLGIDARHTAVVGFSQGAIVASCLIGLVPACHFVLANGRVLPAAAGPTADTHVLILAGEHDTFAPVSQMRADLRSACHPRITYELFEIPGAAHEMTDRGARVVARYLNVSLMNEQKAS